MAASGGGEWNTPVNDEGEWNTPVNEEGEEYITSVDNNPSYALGVILHND